MALLFRGRTRCPLCGQVIQEGDQAVMFAPMVPDPADPLHVFHDASFHAACFDAHPLSDAAEEGWGDRFSRDY
jgi:hypothetical protein